MKLLYATSITLPSYRANRIQITSMARAWTKSLGKDFMLGIGAGGSDFLGGINFITMGENIKSYKLAWKYLNYVKSNTFTHIYCREEKMILFMVVYNYLFFRIPFRMSFKCNIMHHGYHALGSYGRQNMRWHKQHVWGTQKHFK